MDKRVKFYIVRRDDIDCSKPFIPEIFTTYYISKHKLDEPKCTYILYDDEYSNYINLVNTYKDKNAEFILEKLFLYAEINAEIKKNRDYFDPEINEDIGIYYEQKS